jgi:hypothetical protein
VEEKGYKNMINLPDWLNIHNKIIKCENGLKNRGIILFPAGSFSPENRNTFAQSG